MNYRDALDRLLGLVDLERVAPTPRTRVRYDLRRMESLLHRLGEPHLDVPTVHVAGTKGKGSTAAMCARVLSRQGYATGLFSSPHLHTFRERIRLDGAPVSEEEFAALLEQVWPRLEAVGAQEAHGEVTMFEALTAMAFCHFRESARFQVLEVGLGGRLDTTNLVQPPGLKVCAITSLSLDHTSVLGDTLESIAREKAGIIKAGVPVVTSPQQPQALAVIREACRDRGAPLILVGEDVTWRPGSVGMDGQDVEVDGRLGRYQVRTPLLGDYQQENVATAVAVLEVLREAGVEITDEALAEGLAGVCWPCRMEVLKSSPLVVCDGAHNPYSAGRLRNTLPAYFDYQRVTTIVGVSRDKNMEGIVSELAPLARSPGVTEGLVIATSSRHPRAASTEAVAQAFRAQGIKALQVSPVHRAVQAALDSASAEGGQGAGTMILVTGSLFVAAEAREALKGIEPELYPQLDHRTGTVSTGEVA